ncbi:MAG: nicotinate (nicotinamide) nucleotide adenylyltransferase [Deltaproteobacteria bacterium]|nr:nicotinate (nicotinamide) nucleotide adenylyltransferase [Deltaproteobacteria bacterium]
MHLEPAPIDGVRTTLDGVAWQIITRPGYVGHRGARAGADNDVRFGKGGWTIAYLWGGGVIGRDAALSLYEDAYVHHLERHPDVLDWLCATASEVYDTAPTNVASRLDFHAQEGGPTHLQDVALRRALLRLGRAFRGDHLVQIRGRGSEGYRLNPGVVAFHAVDRIVRPTLPGWWQAGSVEDFWQSNKVLLAASDVPEATLEEALLCPLRPASVGAIAHYGGSFNPVHEGHLRIARELVVDWGYGQVVFVPNGDWYRKRHLAPAEDRLRMVELAVAGEPRFIVSDHELRAPKQVLLPASVAALRARWDERPIHVVRGSDAIPRMLRWRSLPDILATAEVIVVPRPGHDPWRHFGQDLRFRLSAGRFRLLRRTEADVASSSQVRACQARGESLRGLVPAAVERYLVERGLYR